jgi:hypothetical protein
MMSLTKCTAPLVLLALVAAERPAHACSCDGSPIVLSPRADATDVPRNARLAIYVPYTTGEDAPEVVLREAATGAEVALSIESMPQGNTGERILFATPDAPLAAGTVYEIALPSPFGEHTHSFTVGDALDETPPAFAGLAGFEAHSYPYPGPGGCYNSCVAYRDRFSRLELDYEGPGADTAFLLLEVRLQGQFTPAHVIPFPWGSRDHVGSFSCSPALPRLEPGQTYCARLWAHDAAGNVAGGDAPVCAVAATCRNVPNDDCVPERGCTRPGGCAVAPGPATPGSGAGVLLLAGLMLVLAARPRSARSV